ncbi:MAG TPA: ATP-binding protein [Pyrinomonadaceae bacterium]|nr:ATP-binding protein [Pyrinomonadaceae bacterium]
MRAEAPNLRDERILIFAPTGRDAALTARFLGDANLLPVTCESVEHLCLEISEGAGLVFLTGEALTPEAMQCLVGVLAEQPSWSDIPVVILTSGGGGTPTNVSALSTLSEAGNVTLIERPVRVMTLMSAFKSALRARRHQYDVRERLEAERRTLREAEEANRMKDEFLATLSHELRTPLTAILGWARMLSGGQLDDASTARALETIERNAKAQSQLIEDILDVSRVITGKLRLEVQPVNLAAVIEAAINAVIPAADAKGIRLQRVLDTGASMVSGDPARLQQVIWNLLSNAIKFTPRDGRVQVRLERTGSHVEITVADDGQGIGLDILPHVFERFRQADSSTTRAHGGLGLGLAIVRHLVEMHGGTVRAESCGEGQGATFTIKLPLVAMRALDARRASDAERVHRRASGGVPFNCPSELEGLRLLVVDDEADTRTLLKAVLEQCGASVVAVASAGEALAALKETRPDVLISDLGMPGEDGYAFIKKVRALPAEDGGQTPSAALTAYARVEDRMKVLRAGFQIHIPKPVEPAELIAVVANLAGRTAV